jgi:hypothetical protein
MIFVFASLLIFQRTTGETRLSVLVEILNGTHRKIERKNVWNEIEVCVYSSIKQRGKVEITELSPDQLHLAVCLEIRTWFGLKVRYAGLIYSLQDQTIIGTIIKGKREKDGWQIDNEPR